jgi:hypothetical protein
MITPDKIIYYIYWYIFGKPLVIDGRNVLTGKYTKVIKPIRWVSDLNK